MLEARSSIPTRQTACAAARHRLFAAPLACAVLVALGLAAVPQRVSAQGLEGSWSGGGTVSFATGARERARCRARYSRKSETSYTLAATCATASGRADQTATLRKVGKSSYSGSFHNAEYGVSGTIHVTVRGNSQSVRLSSGGGTSGSLRLSR